LNWINSTIYQVKRYFHFLKKKIELKNALRRENASLEVRAIVDKAIKNMQTAEVKECTHPTMKDIGEGSMFYQCEKCERVFMLTVAPSWDPMGFDAMMNELKNVEFTSKGKK